MRKLLLVLLIMITAGGVLYYRGDLKPDYIMQHLPNKKNPDEFKLYGNVEIRQVLLGFRVSGRIMEVCREEGDYVKFGDILGSLDPVPYEIRLAEAKAALKQAQASLNKMKKGSRDAEIREAAARCDQIRSALTLAEKDYERVSNLFEQKALAKNELDKAVSKRNSLKAELSAAENALSLVKDGYRKEDIEAAEAQVEVCQARFQAANNALSDTKLYAPSDGTILTRVSEPGTIVNAGQVVYALALSKPVQVRAYVSEPQLGRVRTGMKGKIITDSFPEPIEGTLVFISPAAEFTPKQVQTEDLRTDLVYRVRFLVEDNKDERLKNGMPVTVLLNVGSEEKK